MNTFLSIDLDYFGMTRFGYSKKGKHNNKKFITDFISKSLSLKVPTIIIESHEHILTLLNKRKYDKVINVDFHSDIVIDEGNEVLNEGTWANHYRYKKSTVFEWRYPNKEACLYEGNGVCGYWGSYTTEWKPSKMGFKRVIHKEGIDNINFNSIDGVGICISPTWYCKEDIDFIFNKFDILNHDKYGYTELILNKGA